MQKGKLVVISGPSAGVGKDTILKLFLAKHPDWNQPTSTTTRSPRPGEVDGRDMHFVDRKTFEEWQKEGKFLETDFHADNWYGTLREPVDQLLKQGKHVILRIDVNGSLLVKAAIPEAILIFVTAENLQTLEQRIRARGTEDEAAIERRLELAKTELPYQTKFDHVIVNPSGHPEKALQALENLI